MKKPVRLLFVILMLFSSGCSGDEPGNGRAAGLPAGNDGATRSGAAEPREQVVVLEEYAGSGVSGELRVQRRPEAIELTVSVRDAPAGTNLPVRLHGGSCDALDLAFAELESVSISGAGLGEMRTSLDAGEHPELGSPAALALHVQDEEALPVACGEMP